MMMKTFLAALIAASITASALPVISTLAADGALDTLTLPYTQDGYKISGNITLPDEINGTKITWTSSNQSVIDAKEHELSDADKAKYGSNYTLIPAGTVTRQSADTSVTLTAQAEGGETKTFDVTVKAAPPKSYKQMDEDGDFKGYLYAYFSGTADTLKCQQTYFASSDDGLNWNDLNDNEPVITSTLGTKGLRDHYIIRSPEGDRFYLLATDLDASGGNWTNYATKGSKDIMVWESDDLVNWSEQRAITIADDKTGCMWAPEALYDEITGEYIVYWSGHDIDSESSTYGKKVIYYVKTRDFYSFTPQQKYVEPISTDGVTSGTSDSFIDTTMIRGSDGKYYRVTKYEDVSPTQVFMDVSDYPLGNFTRVATNLSDSDFLGTEGPGLFKFNKDDAEKTGYKYCLMLDGYNGPNTGVGFFPSVTADLNNTSTVNFTKVTSGFKMPTGPKHGGVLPLTQEEYERVNTAYANSEHIYSDVIPDPVAEYDFEESSLSDINAEFTTGASLVSDSETSSNALYLNGASGSYMEFAAPKDENGDVLESYTVSFDVKNNTTGNYFNFYIGDGTSKSKGVNYLGVKAADSILVSTVDSDTEKKTTLTASGIQGNWMHFDVVVSYGVVTVYADNDLKGEMTGYKMSDISASVIRFGFSPWSADNASKAYYDNIKVYGCALSSYAITGVKSEPRPEESADNDKLLFAMNFNNQDLTAIKGKATAAGSISYETSNDTTYAAKLDGSASWLSLTNADGTSLLKDKDQITVTFFKKADSATSWWFYAAPNDNTQTYQQEHYAGILDSGSTITAERYNNSGARNESPTYDYTQGLWQEITLVIGDYRSTLYVNGRAVSEKEYDFKLSDMLGDNPVTYIGKANWGSGEWASGLIDDIAIFDFAPDIDLGNLSDVKADITLPSAAEETDGYSVSWKSSDESVVTSDGKITIPSTGKKTATLTATITFGTHTLTKDFKVIVKADDYYDYSLQIKNEKGVNIQNGMYGLFFEDINYAADGGLYAEMIENRSFESLKANSSGDTSYDGLYGWSAYPSSGSGAKTVLKSSGGLNENNTHYLTFTSSAVQNGFKNQAYDGVYMEQGKTYNVSLYAKKTSSDLADTSVFAHVYIGGKLAAEAVVTDTLTTDWVKYEAKITPDKTVRNADFVITLSDVSSVDFDMISCIPEDAVMGIFRRDLAEKIKAINPGFLRFPGGCIIEGYNLANRYNWKDTIGGVEERKQNWSRWACHTSEGLDSGFKHYNQTYGIGYYEYFLLCEYLNCDAVPVVNVGMACEYQSSETVAVYQSDGTTYTDEFYQYIQDALDLIEFANGDSSTTWGKVRAEMGHPEPFGLKTIGIGNEQWAKSNNQWYTRYEAFEQETHKVYPDMQLISTSGPSASGTDFTSAWNWIRSAVSTNENFTYAVDEHYYMSPSWFLENDDRYDNYDRNVKVFAGEYASQGNNLHNALAEAAFMTGLERNADVVYMASYAPLFARINYTQWSPDMIWYNDAESYASPDYYVQKMYSNNTGDYTLNSTVAENEDKVYQTVSYDRETGDIIIKISNPYEANQRVKLLFDDSFKITGEADVETLNGNSNSDTNTIDNPEKIKTSASQIQIADGAYYDIPSLSFIVMRVHTEGIITVKSTEKTSDGVKYALNVNGDISDCDLYTAVYKSDGTLSGLIKNQTAGEIKADIDDNSQIKFMLWEKESMTPVIDVLKDTLR